jgi:hypothetical protein
MSKTNPSPTSPAHHPVSPAATRGTFDLASVLSADAYPHSHTFTGGGFKGLTIRYRDLPSDCLQTVAAHVSAPLEKLGLECLPTVLHLLGGVELTGEEFLRFESAAEALTAEQKQELATILASGIQAVAASVVGSWNASGPIETELPALLERYPSMCRAIFQLAKSATLAPEK